MAESEVTLLLGEQMAIIYLGVNVLVPLILSAVLAFITLLVVQLSRFVKKRMGSSYSKVVTLTPIVSEKSDVAKTDIKGKPSAMKDTSSVTGHAVVRKRRPSIISETAASPEPLPSVSSEGSFSSSDHILPPGSRPASAASRIRRIASSNRVSPETPLEDRPRTPAVSGAWTERMFIETKERSVNSRMKRKNSDRIISPSQCNVDGLTEDANGNTDKRNSVFSDDMNVFEIW